MGKTVDIQNEVKVNLGFDSNDERMRQMASEWGPGWVSAGCGWNKWEGRLVCLGGLKSHQCINLIVFVRNKSIYVLQWNKCLKQFSI